ncbi:MAG: hypothetical protein NVSMB46_03370 [Candidatus Saccharimonadales bacterium]
MLSPELPSYKEPVWGSPEVIKLFQTWTERQILNGVFKGYNTSFTEKINYCLKRGDEQEAKNYLQVLHAELPLVVARDRTWMENDTKVADLIGLEKINPVTGDVIRNSYVSVGLLYLENNYFEKIYDYYKFDSLEEIKSQLQQQDLLNIKID